MTIQMIRARGEAWAGWRAGTVTVPIPADRQYSAAAWARAALVADGELAVCRGSGEQVICRGSGGPAGMAAGG